MKITHASHTEKRIGPAPPAVELSRGTMRNIRHNLFWTYPFFCV